jgi:hypothetical protein
LDAGTCGLAAGLAVEVWGLAAEERAEAGLLEPSTSALWLATTATTAAAALMKNLVTVNSLAASQQSDDMARLALPWVLGPLTSSTLSPYRSQSLRSCDRGSDFFLSLFFYWASDLFSH